MNNCLPTPDKGRDKRQKYRNHQSPTWWTSVFYWGYIQEYAWKIIYRSRNDWESAVSPKPHLSKGGNSWNLETWIPLHNLQTGQKIWECVYQLPLLGSMAGFCHFRATQLFSASSRHLGWSDSSRQLHWSLPHLGYGLTFLKATHFKWEIELNKLRA